MTDILIQLMESGLLGGFTSLRVVTRFDSKDNQGQEVVMNAVFHNGLVKGSN